MPSHQIICLKCAERKPGDYPGEWWVRVIGKARGFNGDFVCDLCNATIPKGTECVAQSLGLDRTPYQPGWEKEYLGDAPGEVDGTIRVYSADGTVQEIPPK